MKSIKNITFVLAALAVMQGCKRDDILHPQVDDNRAAKASSANILAAPGTIYFSQDFNSSTNYTDYIGTGIGSSTTLFNNMRTNNTEYATINTSNNTLQIVKTGDGISGTHRASVTRTTNLAGGPPGFLKYSMDIVISNNSKDIDNGFQFTVGEITSDAPAAPGRAEIHSILKVNPTKNPGEFKLQTGLDGAAIIQDSEPLSGPHKIVWYINNTGAPVGYTAPDGLPGSVSDDAADVWVIDAGGNAKVVIEEAPALSPEKKITRFKIANNPNFTATIDIDNLVLSEEATVPVPSIVSVAQPPAIEVPYKSRFELLPLAEDVEVTYDDGSKDKAKVRWEPGPDGYNQYMLGTYTAVGTIVPNRGTINPDPALQTVQATVTLRNDLKIVNAFTPNGDGINDTWINPELKLYPVISVEVFDRNGVRLFHTTDPDEGWDGKNQHGQIIAGSYSYIIRVPDLLLVKKGTLTLIK